MSRICLLPSCFDSLSVKVVFYIQSILLPLVLWAVWSEAMATAASATTDLTTCPVCKDMYDNPKSLPCLHAFCLRCLQQLCRGKSPGDEASCPVCRREFLIPQDGVGGLQHHFIVQQLVDRERERIRLRGSSCEKHNDREVEVYCHDCKENICLKCLVVKHRDHSSDEIPEVAENLRPRMNADDQQVLSAINTVREQSSQTKQEADEFLRNADEVKKKILAVGEAVKNLVDGQISDLLADVQLETLESVMQAASVQEAYQQTLAPMERFHTDMRELLDKGRPCDITRAACELRHRAAELLDYDLKSIAVKFNPPHVTFTPADVTQVKCLNLIGKLTVTTEEQPGVSYLHLSHFLYGIFVFQTF